jgi:hypothetical protein
MSTVRQQARFVDMTKFADVVLSVKCCIAPSWNRTSVARLRFVMDLFWQGRNILPL